MLSEKAVHSQLPVNVLRAFLFNTQTMNTQEKVHAVIKTSFMLMSIQFKTK